MAMNNTYTMYIAANLSKDLKKVTPPTFYGRVFEEYVEAWIKSMEKYFLVRNYTRKCHVVWATFQLMGEVGTWWENVLIEKKFPHGELNWEESLQHFCKWWLPQLYFDKKSSK